MANSFPELQKCGITFSQNPLMVEALEYTKQHTTPATVNHCLRAAAFALLVILKHPQLSEADKDLVTFSCIMHDLGWATDPSLISQDKRFEVDGANLARDWIDQHRSDLGWDQRQIQLVWDAIALHATRSIALYKEPEVAATALAISMDFLGPNVPGGLMTVEEYKEIVDAFPRLNFRTEVVQIICGLCRDKPETTFDNFVSDFGKKFGLDGNGTSKTEFAEKVEENSTANVIMTALYACEEYEK